MAEFFQPPPAPAPRETPRHQRPPPSVRPHGTPPGVVATQLLLARAPTAAIHISYLDAHPTGFEFELTAIAVTTEGEVFRDVFGRHWPAAGERSDELPPKLLRVGVEFADGRRATNVTGHDQPAGGPGMWPLTGGRGGGRFHQAYWVSPLPPPGPLALVVEWPAGGISLVRHEIDAQLILEATDRAQADSPEELVRTKDGSGWRIGTDAEVAWINSGTSQDTAITAALPPLFDAYATLELPGTGDHDPASWREDPHRHDEAVLAVLSAHTVGQPWWLGYLNTGAADVIFYDVSPVTLYSNWEYVLIEAGPDQARHWRGEWDPRWKGALPDLMFPADHSWLVATLWDDDWTCIGGSRELINAFLDHPDLRHRARPVDLSIKDATPPGHSERGR